MLLPTPVMSTQPIRRGIGRPTGFGWCDGLVARLTAVGIGPGGINAHIRQRQGLKKGFQSRIITACWKPELTQIPERIQPIHSKIQRAIGLDPSKLRADFQSVATNRSRKLILNLINSREIAQRN